MLKAQIHTCTSVYSIFHLYTIVFNKLILSYIILNLVYIFQVNEVIYTMTVLKNPNLSVLVSTSLALYYHSCMDIYIYNFACCQFYSNRCYYINVNMVTISEAEAQSFLDFSFSCILSLYLM